MAKKKITYELYSYGIYSRWERQSKELPKLLEITTQIPIKPDIEFGYVIKIKGAKGKRLKYKIDHPAFENRSGNIEPPFEGEVYINSNNYEFFLGDTVWEPYDDKVGKWKLSTVLDDELIAYKELVLSL